MFNAAVIILYINLMPYINNLYIHFVDNKVNELNKIVRKYDS